MIKQFLLAGVATIGLATGARAQCSCATNQVTNGDTGASQYLTAALAGNTVCVASGGGGWENQEWHQGGPNSGNLTDYKKGPTDPIDPTKTVGTWSISGNGASTRVTYSYSGGSVGSYAVCSPNSQPGPGNTIGFCANEISSSTVSATLKAGSGGCQ